MRDAKSRIYVAILLTLGLSVVLQVNLDVKSSQTNDEYVSSNAGIDNIQTSNRITGAGMDPGTGHCISSVQFKGNAESMLAIDPKNPDHVVGASHFIYKFASGAEFSGSVGVHTSDDGGHTWDNHIVTGFDCTSKISKTTIFRTYDPVIAFDSSGTLFAAILPDYGAGSGQNLPLYVSKSADGGATWIVANGGNPIFVPGASTGSADKEWIIVDNYASSRFFGTIYVVWVAFHGYGNSEILLSKSTDNGETFTKPIYVSPLHEASKGYAWPIPALAPDGTLFVNFIKYLSCNTCESLDEMLVKSTDGGSSFSSPSKIATVLWHQYPYPETTFRAGIYQSFIVNPANGHLLMAVENATGGSCYGQAGACYGVTAADTNILLYESTDGGESWNKPILVNDNPNEPTNQFQPVVAASPSGLVGVAFYDRRLACPAASGVLPDDIGRKNHCIDTSMQFYTDQESLSAVRSNIRVTKSSWDPNNAASFGGKNAKLPFIGDYFGLALTDSVAYPFFTANYDLGQNPTYDMQIFVALAKVPISLGTTSTATGTAASQFTSVISVGTSTTAVISSSSTVSSSQTGLPLGIPGFAWESIVFGVVVGLVVLAILRRRPRSHLSRSTRSQVPGS